MALFNFRSDRMVEISKAFEYEDFNAFDRKRFPKVSLIPYHAASLFSLGLSQLEDISLRQDPGVCQREGLSKGILPAQITFMGMIQYSGDLKLPATQSSQKHLCPAQTKFVGMMQYDGDLKLPARFLVPPPAISGVSGELLAQEGVTTFACSETQKFGHVSPALSQRVFCFCLYSPWPCKRS